MGALLPESYDSPLPVVGATVEMAGLTDRRFQGTIVNVSQDQGIALVECPELHGTFPSSIFDGFRVGDVVTFSLVVYQDGRPQAKDLRDARLLQAPQALPQAQAVASAPAGAAAPAVSPSAAAALTAAVDRVTALLGAATANTGVAGGGEVALQVELEPDIIGAFVGRQGCVIMELQKQAGGGVHIQVQPAVVPGGNQICCISGPQPNAEFGHKLVMDKLNEIRRQRALYDAVRGVGMLSSGPLGGTIVSASDLEAALSVGEVGLLRSASEGSIETLVNLKAADASNALVLGTPGPTGEVTHLITVDPDIVGAFVGKRGQCIMDLQSRAGGGVHIQVHQPSSPGAAQVSEVTGPKPSADLGVLFVRQKLDELRHAKSVADRLKADGLVPSNGGGLGPQSGLLIPTAPGLESHEAFNERVTLGAGRQASYELDVPAPLVGALVGKRGSVVMELQARAGPQVHIQVHPPIAHGSAQVCEITGAERSAEMGAALVKQKLMEIREQRWINDPGRAARAPAPVALSALGASPAPVLPALQGLQQGLAPLAVPPVAAANPLQSLSAGLGGLVAGVGGLGAAAPAAPSYNPQALATAANFLAQILTNQSQPRIA